MRRKWKIEKWFTRNFGPRKYSWVDKKMLTSSILKLTEMDIKNVKSIYKYLKLLNADNANFQKILSAIEKENYKTLFRLSSDTAWGEDELGDVPISSVISLYIIIDTNNETRLHTIFFESKKINGYYNYESGKCILSKSINERALNLITNFIEIYPYE